LVSHSGALAPHPINQVDGALHRIRDFRAPAFSLDKLDNQLGAMVLIRALSENYKSCVSSVLLKNNLDKAAVQIVFEEIYMKHPEGFHIGGPNKVCRLRKSLYGLKQSAQQWNKTLHSVLNELGFKRIESDRSVYIYSNGEVRIIVPIYIDDITPALKSPAEIDKYVQLLSQHFKCCDLGATCFLLGIAVETDWPTRTLKLHQCQFILDTLEKYGMSDCKPVQTPLPHKLPLSHSMAPHSQEDKDFMSKVLEVSNLVDCAMLLCFTRIPTSSICFVFSSYY